MPEKSSYLGTSDTWRKFFTNRLKGKVSHGEMELFFVFTVGLEVRQFCLEYFKRERKCPFLRRKCIPICFCFFNSLSLFLFLFFRFLFLSSAISVFQNEPCPLSLSLVGRSGLPSSRWTLSFLANFLCSLRKRKTAGLEPSMQCCPRCISSSC